MLMEIGRETFWLAIAMAAIAGVLVGSLIGYWLRELDEEDSRRRSERIRGARRNRPMEG